MSKAIDKAAGAEREVVGQRDRYRDGGERQNLGDESRGIYETGLANGVADVTAPATDDAERWQGWGTALKPATEPIVVARKPLIGTVVSNVLAHGTGALNIDGTRVGYVSEADKRGETRGVHAMVTPYEGLTEKGGAFGGLPTGRVIAAAHEAGRWPANVLLVHAEECVCIGTRKVSSQSGGVGVSRQRGTFEGGHGGVSGNFYAGEEVEAWECVEGCPVAEMDRQSAEAGMHSDGEAD